MADINLRPGEIPLDDPQINDAMEIYDSLNPREQREIFRSLYCAVTAFNRTGDVDHLTHFANSVDVTLLLHGDPVTRQEILQAPTGPSAAEDLMDVSDLVKRLRE
ncbi:hypothetical protein Ppa06_00460 [Planomonospora parontospora subsp. parontospora]|uniref:Uncharacterized protein n=2 Tax=Planomonospora parontospora TaxID=58119 RepID=A0AA37BB72_9ACTN|nr:hypothetical protein [Planomonospora parontospora]GGK44751.1 hypothetical protein GCM10010126_00460 [Planomonospora parontospora]GII06248.1 hypothetical protein Ppa06_00460 [Planomonospora parontospora subsp. parontospora]